MIKALLELDWSSLDQGQLINFGVALLGIGATLTMLIPPDSRLGKIIAAINESLSFWKKLKGKK
tara:strand:+ start:13132 stop:13323 length:192 start_codon:yes stop_codon:yes gene_type:complete